MIPSTNYSEKLNVIFNALLKLEEYRNCIVPTKNIVYIEGGEMVGTTTLTNNIKKVVEDERNFYTKLDDKILFSREPSLDSKKRIIDKYGEKAFLDANEDTISGIIDMFMEDRYINQNQKGNIVSDRGLLSTFVYQSGILDDSVDISYTVKICDWIINKVIKYNIALPKKTIIVCSLIQNPKMCIEQVFKQRLEKRITNLEQELDVFDSLPNILKVNDVYSKLYSLLSNNRKTKDYYYGIELDTPQDIMTTISMYYVNVEFGIQQQLYILKVKDEKVL